MQENSRRIIARYSDRVRDVAHGPDLPRWSTGAAAGVLDEIVTSLRLGTEVGEAADEPAVGPALFDVTFEELNRLRVRCPGFDGHFPLAVRALHRSVAGRISAGTAEDGAGPGNAREMMTEERRRIARELHDRIGSTLGTAVRNLELYERCRCGDPEVCLRAVRQAREAAQATLADARDLMDGLRGVAPTGGLRSALLRYADSAATSPGDVSVVVDGEERRIPGALMPEFFLICREALRNAVTHAGPSTVGVRIEITADEVRAVVEDDGAGFDPSGVTPRAGLESMRERARLVGGRVGVTSETGRGTRVVVVLPMPAVDVR